MKKIYALLLTALAGSISFAQVTDPFMGTGALNTNGWNTHSGTAGQLMISSGSITYPGLTPIGNKAALVSGNSEDLNKACPSITTTGYYSAVINVPNTTGLTATATTGDYMLHFGSNNGASAGTLNGRLYIRTGSVANTFNLAILNTSGGTVTPTYLATDFPINTPLFVVVKHDVAGNVSNLWVNPALDGVETAADATNNTGTTPAPLQLGSICLRQGTSSGNVEFDDIRMGTTWAYVTSSVLSVKENSISGLKVYPNPVTDGKLFISSDLNLEKNVAIYDVVGKQVFNTTTSNELLNVSNLNAGVYIVKITEEGKTATRKLVVK